MPSLKSNHSLFLCSALDVLGATLDVLGAGVLELLGPGWLDVLGLNKSHDAKPIVDAAVCELPCILVLH